MRKRFTDADKWRNPWYRNLSSDGKLAFGYATDNCDASGVWEPDFELADFCINRKINWESVKNELGDRLRVLPDGKWYLTKFIRFQYGQLSRECKAHVPVFAAIEQNGLEKIGIPIPIIKGIYTLQETETEKEKETEISGRGIVKGGEKTQLQTRIEKWFHRRPTTQWDAKEMALWSRNRAVIEATMNDELELLDWWYSLPDGTTCRRKAIEQLLGHWNTEILRALAHRRGDAPVMSCQGQSAITAQQIKTHN